ncbi:hypothetical protein VCHC71A1_00572B, partial [Vibrio cholerae HC-71A1]
EYLATNQAVRGSNPLGRATFISSREKGNTLILDFSVSNH